MDVSALIKHRLEEFGLDQRDLARAAQVTESYISQLLSRKKAPPAPSRTDIYGKMDKVLRLPEGELARLATLQRREQVRRELGDEPAPLFQEVRALILRKCNPKTEKQLRAVFEKEPFGEVERVVTQRLLDVVKRVAKDELDNEYWLRMVADLGGRSYEEMRVVVLQFLDADILDISVEDCASFLEPLVESWDFDLAAFTLEIVLNPRVVPGHVKRFEFVEQEPDPPGGDDAGLQEFLRDASLSGTATEDEIQFLKRLRRVRGKQPTALYYYRELQNLRDPLHFRPL
ncbi:MAG TPA: helix-turn-helix transcriptional regulator [Gemmatimonadales bacterium]|nr:helix-turn-helix transcriptional regulator [Gemmatimonadales bacterium]